MFTEAFLLLLFFFIEQTVSLGAKQDMEFTFILPAGASECFYQPTLRGDTMEFEYQVIAGSGLDVGFSMISPSGQQLVSGFRKSDGIHMVDPTEDGDYSICFDNSFSKMSLKMVFFGVVLNAQSGTRSEWDTVDQEDSLLDYTLGDIRLRLETMHRDLERTRQVQAALRAFEARDRYVLEDNLWRVSFWSCLTLLLMLTVASAQIHTLKKLFDEKKKVTTRA
ncbi:unnamed protein product [Knipowitschia caucasica]